MPSRDRSKKSASGEHPPDPKTGSPESPWDEFPKLRDFVESAGKDLDRLIIVRPGFVGDVSYLEKLFCTAGREVPEALGDWESRVDLWCDEYRTQWLGASVLEINLRIAVYIFDRTLERVLLAYGLSCPQLEKRDANRMRRFPDVNIGVRRVMGAGAVACDRGHFLGHAAGGELDINLFPQRRRLNRGWSPQGKLFRRMELHAATQLGTFVYHRPMYDDDTWIPEELEYGILVDDREWWTEVFSNKKEDA